MPNIQDSNAQKALLYGAVLDSELHNQISIGNSPIEFVQVVVGSLINYGILNDGRIAIIAILEVSKQFIGHDKRSDCDKLIKAVQTAYNRQERMSC